MILLNEYISHQGLKPSTAENQNGTESIESDVQNQSLGAVNFQKHFASIFDPPDMPHFLSSDVDVGGCPWVCGESGSSRLVCVHLRVFHCVCGHGTIH